MDAKARGPAAFSSSSPSSSSAGVEFSLSSSVLLSSLSSEAAHLQWRVNWLRSQLLSTLDKLHYARSTVQSLAATAPKLGDSKDQEARRALWEHLQRIMISLTELLNPKFLAEHLPEAAAAAELPGKRRIPMVTIEHTADFIPSTPASPLKGRGKRGLQREGTLMLDSEGEYETELERDTEGYESDMDIFNETHPWAATQILDGKEQTQTGDDDDNDHAEEEVFIQESGNVIVQESLSQEAVVGDHKRQRDEGVLPAAPPATPKPVEKVAGKVKEKGKQRELPASFFSPATVAAAAAVPNTTTTATITPKTSKKVEDHDPHWRSPRRKKLKMTRRLDISNDAFDGFVLLDDQDDHDADGDGDDDDDSLYFPTSSESESETTLSSTSSSPPSTGAKQNIGGRRKDEPSSDDAAEIAFPTKLAITAKALERELFGVAQEKTDFDQNRGLTPPPTPHKTYSRKTPRSRSASKRTGASLPPSTSSRPVETVQVFTAPQKNTTDASLPTALAGTSVSATQPPKEQAGEGAMRDNGSASVEINWDDAEFDILPDDTFERTIIARRRRFKTYRDWLRMKRRPLNMQAVNNLTSTTMMTPGAATTTTPLKTPLQMAEGPQEPSGIRRERPAKSQGTTPRKTSMSTRTLSHKTHRLSAMEQTLMEGRRWLDSLEEAVLGKA